MVREALLTSVACTRPPVSFHISQLSTVPKASRRARRRCARPARGRASSGSWCPRNRRRSPARCLRAVADGPGARSCAQSGSARRSCQTMALVHGWPVRRFHTTVVSRWLVMPMAAMSPAFSPALRQRLLRVASWLAQISSGRAPPSRAAGRSGGTRAAPSRRCGRARRTRCCASWTCPGPGRRSGKARSWGAKMQLSRRPRPAAPGRARGGGGVGEQRVDLVEPRHLHHRRAVELAVVGRQPDLARLADDGAPPSPRGSRSRAACRRPRCRDADQPDVDRNWRDEVHRGLADDAAVARRTTPPATMTSQSGLSDRMPPRSGCW